MRAGMPQMGNRYTWSGMTIPSAQLKPVLFLTAALFTFGTLWLVLSEARVPAPSPPSPSVLLITLDTVRADHLGCYGDAGSETPAIDALAAAGLRFENAYAQAPITLPSHAVILARGAPRRPPATRFRRAGPRDPAREHHVQRRQDRDRPIPGGDVDLLFKWLNDADAARLDLAYRPTDWIAFKAWTEAISKDQGKVLFAVRRIGEAPIIGFVGLSAIQPVHRSADLGVRIGDEANRNQGFGTEAAHRPSISAGAISISTASR